MPLFNPKTIEKALKAFAREPSDAELAAATKWARMAREDFGGQNESQLEADLNTIVMQGALGYQTLGPDGPGSIRAKQAIGAGTVDLALGEFTAVDAFVLAPFELKGPKIGLDSIMSGRNKTPVQQAWEYANDAVGARWVLVSNMKELRLYAIGYGRADYETFDLKQIDQGEELKRLQLLLLADQLLTGATAELLLRSVSEDRDITNALYEDYRSLRDDLLQFVRDQHPTIDADRRIELVQKLLDRLIFIAFAEDTVLVPDNSILRAVEFEDPYDPKPKWRNVVRLFDAVDKGATKLSIPPYNGGLFATDSQLDGLDLPDHLVVRFLDLSQYDYRSEVSVTILGHIFEQSISDIEALLAEARGEALPRTRTRKRFGVVYTPDFVTRFIVEQTIGRHLQEISEQLFSEHAKGIDADGNVAWKSKKSEAEYWSAYLSRLTRLRVIDPACGSGAFLIAAFDLLNAEQKKVRERLGEIEGAILTWANPNADVEIIAANLYGVDINAESVEITKLALWLKTAKRGRALESLELNIRRGNSLIEDSDVDARAFLWRDAFKSIFNEGGFDIVIGNPPYVRMELLKQIKWFLETRYEVVSDRADLYAYFFELGVRLLRFDGRLGYISSSTFFRTSSGAPIGKFLSQKVDIERVIDFGELQIFDGVTTYPTIIILRKVDGSDASAASERENAVRFLNLSELPRDLSAAFDEHAQAMPQSRLCAGSWQFEGQELNAIRRKIASNRKTAGELFGAPLLGVKTGRDEPFLISRSEARRLVDADPRSKELFREHLVGDDLERWYHEVPDRVAIYVRKGEVDIQDFPAIRDRLLRYRESLESRATKQKYYEWQQAEGRGRDDFTPPKICYPLMSQGPKFSIDSTGALTNQNSFIIKSADSWLISLLNSKACWFTLSGIADSLRGGQWRLVLKSHFVAQVPIPSIVESDRGQLSSLGKEAAAAAQARYDLSRSVLHRLADVVAPIETTVAFRTWPDLDFGTLRAAIRKRFKGADFPVSERDDWELWYECRRKEAAELSHRIAAAEAEINARIYSLYDLNKDEIAAVEEALEGQY